MKTHTLLIFFLCLAGRVAFGNLETTRTTVVTAAPFDLSAVELEDSPFRQAMERNLASLLALSPDRLLHNFRKIAGLEPKAPIYGSWESQGVGGQTLGHYLSALSYQYRSTGNEELLSRLNYIVDELKICQDANENGYVSGIPEGKRIFSELSQGKVDVSSGLNGGWVPWYTMHKLLAGLHDVHTLTGNVKARNVLIRLADWVDQVTLKLTPDQLAEMLKVEFGGMNEEFLNVAALTGNDKYRAVADRFFHHAVLDPLARQEDRLEGLHANTQVPKVIGAARRYELLGEARDRTIAEFFWKTVVEHHSYAIGGNSEHEHFGPPRRLAGRLGPTTAETCNTYNMLKLTGELFSWQPNGKYFDYYERALYNHILASQEPEHGAFTYYVSLKAGHFKTWSKPLETFWCCVGTGLENHTRYGESIYYHDGNTLYVNLFIPSLLTWKEKGVEIHQQTRFPEEGNSTLQIKADQPVDMAIRVRKPSWVLDGFSVAVNGVVLENLPVTEGYVEVQRIWATSDTLTVQIPMQLHKETMPDDPRKIALMYGPLVLAGDLVTTGIEQPVPFTDDAGAYFHAPDPAVPVLVTNDLPVTEWVKPVAGRPLTFRTSGVGTPNDVTLVPFYSKYHGRYTVYWDEFTSAGWQAAQAAFQAEEERRQELEARTVDEVRPGEQQMESDHNFRGEKSRTGSHAGRKWRVAEQDGWFSYDVKVLPDSPQQLVCTWWGSDSGQRQFQILVDDTPFQTVTLQGEKPDQFFDTIYDLPLALTRNKKRITIRFEGLPGNIAGGVFGIRVLRGGSTGN